MSHESKHVKSVTYYQPGSIPENPNYLGEFVIRELGKLGDIVYNIAKLRSEQIHIAPEKPRIGDIRYADGSDWNPGQGENIYYFDGTNWIAFGASGGAGDYGQFYDTTNQIAASINTGQGVEWGNTAYSRGVSVDGVDNTKINFTHTGKYYIDFTATIHSENASSKEIYFWPAIDGVDIANSGMVHTLESNNHRKTISRSGIFEISSGSYLQAMWATNDLDLDLHGLVASAFAPAIPSVTLSVMQASQ